jgi:hypothetical protein
MLWTQKYQIYAIELQDRKNIIRSSKSLGMTPLPKTNGDGREYLALSLL